MAKHTRILAQHTFDIRKGMKSFLDYFRLSGLFKWANTMFATNGFHYLIFNWGSMEQKWIFLLIISTTLLSYILFCTCIRRYSNTMFVMYTKLNSLVKLTKKLIVYIGKSQTHFITHTNIVSYWNPRMLETSCCRLDL